MGTAGSCAKPPHATTLAGTLQARKPPHATTLAGTLQAHEPPRKPTQAHPT